jgi:hypothetical protein
LITTDRSRQFESGLAPGVDRGSSA